MSPKIQDLTNEVLQLPREARGFLAEKLLESLDVDESFALSAAWQEEIRRRCKELDEGKVALVPAEEVLRGVVLPDGTPVKISWQEAGTAEPSLEREALTEADVAADVAWATEKRFRP